jgi:surfeit locus 1 family protein
MRRVIPWIMFVLMELTLISLGVWQLERKEWKEDLLKNMQRNQAAPVLQLTDTKLISEDMLFRRVAFTCHYDEVESAFELGFDPQSQIAERAYHICDFKNAPSLVARSNWSPKRPAATKLRLIHATGRFYPWTHESFYSAWVGSAQYDQKKFWTSLRTSGIAPYFVQMGDALPPPPANNHFAYAIQWFIFAGVLLVIFTIWARRQRLAPPGPGA